MAIKVYKPTSPGRRKMSVVDYSGLTKKRPEKSLTVPLKKASGRDRTGRISVRHKAGGAKKLYRIISNLQQKMDIPAKVESIEYDPNRSAFIALVLLSFILIKSYFSKISPRLNKNKNSLF